VYEKIGMVTRVLSTTSPVFLYVVSFEVDLFVGMMIATDKREMSLKNYSACIKIWTHDKEKLYQANWFIHQD